ncbi:hypothetical protein ATERTT37_001914 [Aspergillus terreus]
MITNREKSRDITTTINFIKAKGSQFFNGDDSAQCLVITNITPECVKQLERIRTEERNLGSPKLTYFADETTLIIKLAVLLIKIDKDAKTLIFERWERVHQPSQQPGTRTRSLTEIVPGRVEEVVVNFSNPSNITGVSAYRLFSISANIFRSIAAEFTDL